MDERLKVAVLEDDEMFAALLAELLGEYYDVVIGRNGLQGIALCLEGGVAAVVSEVGLPDFDGVKMLTEFRKNPRLSSIPVFMMTATDFFGYTRAEIERFPQVRGILYKSESPEIIVEAVRTALHGG
ncbi:MAG TPA: response regulator [Elusimicrobiales bacterium]|nr:response regulator [Elusimicrobiales bacterium]